MDRVDVVFVGSAALLGSGGQHEQGPAGQAHGSQLCDSVSAAAVRPRARLLKRRARADRPDLSTCSIDSRSG